MSRSAADATSLRRLDIVSSHFHRKIWLDSRRNFAVQFSARFSWLARDDFRLDYWRSNHQKRPQKNTNHLQCSELFRKFRVDAIHEFLHFLCRSLYQWLLRGSYDPRSSKGYSRNCSTTVCRAVWLFDKFVWFVQYYAHLGIWFAAA